MDLNKACLILNVLSKFEENKSEKNINHQIVVYKAENEETGKYYIGASTKKDRRYKDHLRDLKNNEHCNSRFQNAYNENSNFIFKSAEIEDDKFAFDLERIIIKECLDDPDCLNLLGGSRPAMLGKKHTEESIERMKESQKIAQNKPENILKKKQFMTGKKIGLGYKMPDDIKEQKRIQMLGNKHTLGYSHTDEAKEKISNFGKNRTAELSERIRLGHLRSISIENKNYIGISEASKILNINETTIHSRLNSTSERFKEWYYN